MHWIGCVQGAASSTTRRAEPASFKKGRGQALLTCLRMGLDWVEPKWHSPTDVPLISFAQLRSGAAARSRTAPRATQPGRSVRPTIAARALGSSCAGGAGGAGGGGGRAAGGGGRPGAGGGGGGREEG